MWWRINFVLGLIVFGADRLVSGAVSIATSLGVSDAFVGLTVVAIGTSAPELVTAVVASVRGERDIAVGNLFGSSVYNVLIILGITVIASPGGLDVPTDLDGDTETLVRQLAEARGEDVAPADKGFFSKIRSAFN